MTLSQLKEFQAQTIFNNVTESEYLRRISEPLDFGGETAMVNNAKFFIHRYRIMTDRGGQPYIFNGKYWEEFSELHSSSLIVMAMGSKFTQARAREFYHAVKALSMSEDDDMWGQTADNEISFLNGVLNIDTLKMREHTSNDMFDSIVDHAFIPKGTCPTWEKCLNDWFGGDTDKRKALQLFAGYTLLPHHKYKKALFLYGDTDCGKSVIVNLMRAIIGEKFCGQLPLHNFNDSIKRSVLMGKKLNTCSEVKSGTILQEDMFKAMVSTGEPVLVERKYCNPIQYVFRCKHIIAANAFPTVHDKTNATLNRLCIIPMYNIIPQQKQDPDLLQKLLSEANGIIAWMVQGAREVTELKGYFPNIAGVQQIKDDMRATSNAVKEFIDEYFIYTGLDSDFIPVSLLQQKFYEMPINRSVNRDSFMQQLNIANDSIRRYKQERRTVFYDGQATTQRCLVGFAPALGYGSG